MNWTIDDEGSANFVAPRGGWRVSVDPARPQAGLWIDRAPGGTASPSPAEEASEPAAAVGPVGTIGYRDTSDAGQAQPHRATASSAVIRILPPAGQQFPPLVETYPRGSDLIANLPQTAETEFGLSVCHRILRADDRWLVCETILAVQTDLLGSHPTLDLVADSAGEPLRDPPHVLSASGGSAPLATAADSPAERARQSVPPPLITRLERPGDGGVCFLLLPPSDRAAAEDRSQASDSPLCYRLLAEFLEKGVIRKARFWTCCSAGEPTEEDVSALYEQLMHLPLPLTP